jgi:Ca2+-transporting ATPase
MNLVTDVFPALALAFEPPSPEVMKQRPRDPSTTLLSKNLLILIGWQSMMIALLALTAYTWALRTHGPGAHARTVALFAIIGAQLGHMFNCRSRTRSALDGIFRNPFIWAATLIVIMLQLLAIYVSPLAIVLGTERLSEIDWTVIGFCVVAPVIVVEISKLIVRWQLAAVGKKEAEAS